MSINLHYQALASYLTATEGTVYGNVTLQEDLEISEGESLTLDSGASLDAGDYDVIVDGGTLDSTLATNLGESVIYKVTQSRVGQDQSGIDGGRHRPADRHDTAGQCHQQKRDVEHTAMPASPR